MKKYIILATIIIVAIGAFFLLPKGEPKKMTPSDYSNEALKLNKEGHIHDAIKSLNKAIALKNNDPVLLYNRGTLYLKDDKYKEAIKDFTASLNINNHNFSALLNRGKAYLSINKQQEAIKDFTMAMKLKKNFAPLYFNRGRAYKAAQDKTKAKKDFQTALKMGYQKAKNKLQSL